MLFQDVTVDYFHSGNRRSYNAELQAFQRVVPHCPACIFHPSPARFKAITEARGREHPPRFSNRGLSAGSYPTSRVWCDPTVPRRVFSPASPSPPVPALLRAQTPPRDSTARQARRSTCRPSRPSSPVKGRARSESSLQFARGSSDQLAIRLHAGFLFPSLIPRFVLKSAGTIADQFHVNVDYERAASSTVERVSLYYEGKAGRASGVWISATSASRLRLPAS